MDMFHMMDYNGAILVHSCYFKAGMHQLRNRVFEQTYKQGTWILDGLLNVGNNFNRFSKLEVTNEGYSISIILNPDLDLLKTSDEFYHNNPEIIENSILMESDKYDIINEGKLHRKIYKK